MHCPLCWQELAGPELCTSCGSLEGLDCDKFLSLPDQRPTEPLPVVFLDVDGVLNWVGRSAPEALEPELVEKLALLFRWCSGGAPGPIRVVLSRCARGQARSNPPSFPPRTRPPLSRRERVSRFRALSCAQTPRARATHNVSRSLALSPALSLALSRALPLALPPSSPPARPPSLPPSLPPFLPLSLSLSLSPAANKRMRCACASLQIAVPGACTND